MEFINWKMLLIGFVFGCIAVFFKLQHHRKVFVFPNKENIEHILYRDIAGQCYRVEQEEMPCPVASKWSSWLSIMPSKEPNP